MNLKKYHPKISVIIICYNQEKEIARALDSVLIQKEFVHEIIVSDDSSTDNTWEVLNDYCLKYPDKIKIYQNEANLGVYKNYFAVNDKVTGDIVFRLAGDDVFCDKLFENAIKILPEKKIDYKLENVILLFDFMVVYANGEKREVSNSLVEKHKGISLKLRNLITNRPLAESYAQFKKRYFVEGIDGTVTPTQEGIIDIQPHYYAQDYFYAPFIGSVYYAGIGISRKLKTQERIMQYIVFCDNVLMEFPTLGKVDKRYILYRKSKYMFQSEPNIRNYLKYFFKTIQNVEIKYGLSFFKREYIQLLKSILKIQINKIS